jgi:hypothetical protein
MAINTHVHTLPIIPAKLIFTHKRRAWLILRPNMASKPIDILSGHSGMFPEQALKLARVTDTSKQL